MSSQDTKALELIKKAQKKLSGWSKDYDEGGELYTQAANQYKIAKKMKESADCYVKAAEAYVKGKSLYDAANAYKSAAQCLKKEDVGAALGVLDKACKLFEEAMKLPLAGKTAREAGEIAEATDKELAIEYYEKACSYMEGGNESMTIYQIQQKVASLQGELGLLDDCAATYVKLAVTTETPYKKEEFYFRANLCAIGSGDGAKAKQACIDYSQDCYEYMSTKERAFCMELAQAMKANDEEAYKSSMAAFIKVKRLDFWCEKMLKDGLKGCTPSLSAFD